LDGDRSGRDYRSLPPAVILDLDETAIDNSPTRRASPCRAATSMPRAGTPDQAEQAKAIPGAVEFTTYAASKGVKVFYVTNRSADQKEATGAISRPRLSLGGNVDTFLMQRDRPEWASGAKARHRLCRKIIAAAAVRRQYRRFQRQIQRQHRRARPGLRALKAHFGHDWMMLANPAYGSWESAAYATIQALGR